jgi:hypothetical protein
VGQVSIRKKWDLISKITEQKTDGGVTQAVELLPSKCEAPVPLKEKKIQTTKTQIGNRALGCTPVISAGRLRQEDLEFEVSLGCIVRPCLKQHQEQKPDTVILSILRGWVPGPHRVSKSTGPFTEQPMCIPSPCHL